MVIPTGNPLAKFFVCFFAKLMGIGFVAHIASIELTPTKSIQFHRALPSSFTKSSTTQLARLACNSSAAAALRQMRVAGRVHKNAALGASLAQRADLARVPVNNSHLTAGQFGLKKWVMDSQSPWPRVNRALKNWRTE